jgi:hypothetical protein
MAGSIWDVLVESPGSPGLSTYPEADNFASLPDSTLHLGNVYLVNNPQGVYFVNRKPAGLYRSNGASWIYESDLTDTYFGDALTWGSITSKPTTFPPSAHTHPPQGSYFPSGW